MHAPAAKARPPAPVVPAPHEVPSRAPDPPSPIGRIMRSSLSESVAVPVGVPSPLNRVIRSRRESAAMQLLVHWLPWPRAMTGAPPELLTTVPSRWSEDIASLHALVDRVGRQASCRALGHPSLVRFGPGERVGIALLGTPRPSPPAIRCLASVRNIMHLRGGGGERLAGPVHLLQNLCGRLRPDEGPGVLVVGLDVLLQARF